MDNIILIFWGEGVVLEVNKKHLLCRSCVPGKHTEALQSTHLPCKLHTMTLLGRKAKGGCMKSLGHRQSHQFGMKLRQPSTPVVLWRF